MALGLVVLLCKIVSHGGQANQLCRVSKKMPGELIRDDVYGITDACRRYLSPLIQGEAYPTYQQGLPDYLWLK